MSHLLSGDYGIVLAVEDGSTELRPVGATGPGGPAGTGGGFVVLDGNGTKVGNVISTTDRLNTVVMFEHNGTLIPLRVNPDVYGDGYTLHFESDDCSGQGFAGSPVGGTPVLTAYLRAIVPPPGHTLYLESGEPTSIQNRSFTTTGIGCTAALEIPGIGFSTFSLLPADPLVDLDTLFSPPFTVVKEKFNGKYYVLIGGLFGGPSFFPHPSRHPSAVQ